MSPQREDPMLRFTAICRVTRTGTQSSGSLFCITSFGFLEISVPLKMIPIGSLGTSVRNYHYTLHNIAEKGIETVSVLF